MREVNQKEFDRILEDGQNEFYELLLKDINISNRSIGEIRLENCRFENVKISSCIFERTLDMKNCNFNQCSFIDLQVNDIECLNMVYEGFSMRLENCKFENARISGCTFGWNLDMENCNFNQCSFTDLQINDTAWLDLVYGSFSDCLFENIIVDNAIQGQSDMIQVKFNNTMFKNMQFYINVEMSGCIFEKCEIMHMKLHVNAIREGIFSEGIIEKSEFRGDFSENQLKNTKIRESEIEFDLLELDGYFYDI